ncbi:transposase, partial [Salmonella enterica]|nr:transposase [Salmonella enterica]
LCIIHQIRNSIKYVASKHHKAFTADLKPVYRAVSKEAAETALDELEAKWGQQYASGLLEEAYRQHPALFAAEGFTPEERMNDIRGRLRGGDGGHFICTAVLSDILVEHAEKNFPQRLATLYPMAWR